MKAFFYLSAFVEIVILFRCNPGVPLWLLALEALLIVVINFFGARWASKV